MARAENPKMRERDLAAQLGISEAELVAAHCGDGVLRIEPRVNDLLTGLEAVGEVMALTRNESAVHEKIGVYDKVVTGDHNAMVLGEQIDLRIFPKVWAHGFAVEKRDGDEIRRSLQFFDEAGEAVHKVHLRAGLQSLRLSEAGGGARLAGPVADGAMSRHRRGRCRTRATRRQRRRSARPLEPADRRASVLRHAEDAEAQPRSRRCAWSASDYAWKLDDDALGAMLHHAAAGGMPIMCFVGNRGCIQIHSGPITDRSSRWVRGSTCSTRPSTCICRLDHVRELWAVRKPTKDGHVTSIEAYDADGEMIIQFFGKRHEGEDERDDWRFLAENLPRIPNSTAA